MRKQIVHLCFGVGIFIGMLGGGFSLSAQSPQDNHNWRSLLSIGDVSQIQETPTQIFASSGDAFFTVGKEAPNKVVFFDRSMGVSDIGVERFAFDKDVLLVYYRSGIIDLVHKEGIRRISAIYDNIRLTDKSLNQIFFWKDWAFLAGNFGLSVVSLAEGKILSTSFIGQSVQSVVCFNDEVMILKDNILFKASLSSNLQDPSQWQEVLTGITKPLQLALVKGSVFLLGGADGGEVYSITAPTVPLFKGVKEMVSTQAVGVVLIGERWLKVIREGGKEVAQLPTNSQIVSVSANTSEHELWAADGTSIFRADLQQSNPVLQPFEFNYSGPMDNRSFYGTIAHKRLYMAGGGRGADRMNLPGSLKIYNGTEWENIGRANVEPLTGIEFTDAVSVAVDPKDASHFYVATWGEGLLEFANYGKSIQRYHADNSDLMSAVSGNPNYVRTGSLTIDPRGNLWMAQGSVSKPIAVRTPDGTLKSLSYPAIASVNSFGRMLALPGGTKWLNIYHRGGDQVNGVFVFNDNNTPLDETDDATLLFSQFTDRTGKVIAASHYYDMAVDRSGIMWIGTDRGPIFVHNAAGVPKQSSTPVASRPVGGKEPNLFYVMDNVPVTAIVVDEANNKWMGTRSDGLYLLSPDGTTVYKHFTIDNSPLLSNSISTLNLDAVSGVLYIGTSMGLMAYNIGIAGNFDQLRKEIHVYPNPLRPEDNDKITVSGLSAGVTIRVLDTAGNVLHQDTAITSELSFNARMPNGERYPSGVYQLLVSDANGKQGHTIRFAVIY